VRIIIEHDIPLIYLEFKLLMKPLVINTTIGQEIVLTIEISGDDVLMGMLLGTMVINSDPILF
jgi:hypothetical protein